MIKIAGNTISPGNIAQYPVGSLERKTIEIMHTSSTLYRFDSLKQLTFELNLRTHIVTAAKQLDKSNFSFEIFRESYCNPDYWERTEEGGFLLKEGIHPTAGIRDIYQNSSKYGTECATAMVIVFYKGLADILPEKLFNLMFSSIYLMNWEYLDGDLGIATYRNVTDDIPGDCRYFKNPDVNPLTPEWQGENVIVLGDGTYYGHGIGIRTADKMIESLNEQRRAGATKSAYLLDSATRLDFMYLADRYYSFSNRLQIEHQRTRPQYNRSFTMIPYRLPI
ncbi:MAG: protein-glutamine gamma-glutamyltransferase [Bacillota bacterium]